jgi:hypothetical protein
VKNRAGSMMKQPTCGNAFCRTGAKQKTAGTISRSGGRMFPKSNHVVGVGAGAVWFAA